MATEKPPLPHSLRLAAEMGLDPDDPAYALVKAVEMLQRHALNEMGILVSKLADDIAATSLAAENAARAKAEHVITEAGEWTAGQIRAAGRDAAAEIREALASATKPPVKPSRDGSVWFPVLAVCAVMGVASLLVWLWLSP